MAKMKFLLSEKIDRARDGRSQTWVVIQMKERGIKITDVQFSRKKKGRENFTEEEFAALSEILNVELP